ncbi:unnamed protein product [Aphanomyces euteiches]
MLIIPKLIRFSRRREKMEKKQAVVGDYVVTARIGSGSFAIVYKGYHKITNVPVAVKAINKTKLNPKLLENLESEISIMRQINHPNIVKLYEIKKTDKHIYLMLEYCDGGDLQHFIKKQPNGVLNEETARHFLRELADGLHVLWSLNLIHRDLKPQNLLLTESSATASLKIADFGFARHLESTSLAETLCGSPLYMAPEILQFQKYDNKADLWSVGTILYEMIVGRPPFNGANQVQLLHNIQRETVRFPKDLAVSRDAVALVEGLLVREPRARMSFEQFFSAPFLGRAALDATPVVPPIVRSSSSAPVDIQPAMTASTSSATTTNPALLHSARLHESYRNSLTQSYRRRSASTTLKSSSTTTSSVVTQAQMPISPELVPLNTPSLLRTNPFKSDTPPRSSALVTSTSAPAATAFKPSYMTSAKKNFVANNLMDDPTATTSVALFDCDMQVDSMVARVQTILSLVDSLLPVDPAAMMIQSGSSSPSSSTCSMIGSPMDASLVSDKGKHPGDALVLAMKCLHLLHMVVGQEDAASKRAWIKDLFIQCIDKAEQSKKWLSNDKTPPLSSFQEIIYRHVLRLGREAAVHEVLGQKGAAAELYGHAQLLLESMLLTAKKMQSDDHRRLLSYLQAFKHRIEYVTK